MSDDQDEPQDELADQGTSAALEVFYQQAKERIRVVSHKGEPWYSVVDVVGLLTDAPTPRNYWAMMKERIQDEGFVEVLTKCEQLKMLATDGKMRLTDAANEQTLLRIIQSIPSPRAEPFKQWLAQVGHAYLEDARQKLNADEADSMRREYQRLGYADSWIDARLQGKIVRDNLTQEWHERGAQESREIAILTDVLHKLAFDVTTAKHRKIKNIPSSQPLHDSLDEVETALQTLTDATARRLHVAHDSHGFAELQADAQVAGKIGGDARRAIEASSGMPVVNSTNYKTLRQARQRELQPSLFAEETPADSD